MRSQARALLPLLLIFLFFLIAPFLLSPTIERYHINKNVILWANGLFFIMSILSFSIQRKAMGHKNPHVFVRAVTGGMLMKMLFCVAAVIIYVYISGQAFNKRAVLISLFLYLIYLFTEVMVVMRMNKKQHV